MKKLVFSIIALAGVAAIGPLSAADMPVKARPVMVDPPYNWTGWYIGGNVGYSWGRSSTDLTLTNATTGALLTTGASKFNMNGALGGLQLGYNWQDRNWVWGLEGDIQWTGQKGSTAFSCPGTICALGATAFGAATVTGSITMDQKLQWFSTIRGRVGFTPTPTSYLYATGGLAIGEVKTSGTIVGFVNATPPANVVTTAYSGSETKTGWVVGVGGEASLGGRWTGKIEYLYMDLGRVNTVGLNTTTGILVPLSANLSSKITDNILRVGLNYKFNP